MCAPDWHTIKACNYYPPPYINVIQNGGFNTRVQYSKSADPPRSKIGAGTFHIKHLNKIAHAQVINHPGKDINLRSKIQEPIKRGTHYPPPRSKNKRKIVEITADQKGKYIFGGGDQTRTSSDLVSYDYLTLLENKNPVFRKKNGNFQQLLMLRPKHDKIAKCAHPYTKRNAAINSPDKITKNAWLSKFTREFKQKIPSNKSTPSHGSWDRSYRVRRCIRSVVPSSTIDIQKELISETKYLAVVNMTILSSRMSKIKNSGRPGGGDRAHGANCCMGPVNASLTSGTQNEAIGEYTYLIQLKITNSLSCFMLTKGTECHGGGVRVCMAILYMRPGFTSRTNCTLIESTSGIINVRMPRVSISPSCTIRNKSGYKFYRIGIVGADGTTRYYSCINKPGPTPPPPGFLIKMLGTEVTRKWMNKLREPNNTHRTYDIGKSQYTRAKTKCKPDP